ncbi:MAG: pspA [Burkholderiaceae bacterium]|nr:pspA [Burkholderiaceae bacterium]
MSEATEILIIRHGQTAWNKEKRLQGHSDIPLNERGMQQALALGEALKHEPLNAILSSDMQRALKTAEEIARWHELPVQVDHNLRERCYGVFEGMHPDEIEQQYPASHAAWHAADPDHVFPPGERIAESIRQFYHRVMSALTRCAQQHPGQKVAMVAHFGIVESAYRAANRIPLGERVRMPVLNTSVNRFAVTTDGEITLLAWGEASHLEPLRKPVEYLKHF